MLPRFQPYGRPPRPQANRERHPANGKEERNAYRRFCNWVKLRLLASARTFASVPLIADRRLRTEIVIPSEMVLDLACGRGGDLAKWTQTGYKGVVGLDICCDYVYGKGGVIDRVHNLRQTANANLPGFLAFGVCDCSNVLQVNNAIASAVGALEGQDGIVDTLQFQTVSTQFCLQYFFESQSKLRNLLTLVSDHLPEGGWWIGTSSLGKYSEWPETGMCHLLRDSVVFENRLVKFELEKDSDGIFGREVSFFMQDTLFFDKESREYLVDVDTLVECAAEVGLVPKILVQMNKMAQDWKGGQLNKDEDETASLYFAFAFVKQQLGVE